MVGRLITFPLRVGVRSVQLWFRAAEEVAGRATSGAQRLVGAFSDNGASGSGSSLAERGGEPPRTQRPASRRAQSRPRDSRSHATAPAPDPSPAAASAEPATPAPGAGLFEPSVEGPDRAPSAPVHVSEEPELVREEAEVGAEEGAGAGVTVHEPWEGYARMSAREVITRLADATSAELAAVALYESGNRSRQTVLEAVQRHMRTADGGGSSD